MLRQKFELICDSCGRKFQQEEETVSVIERQARGKGWDLRETDDGFRLELCPYCSKKKGGLKTKTNETDR